MKSEDKVCKIDPKAVGHWTPNNRYIVYGSGNRKLGCQNRESWAWAEAYRNLKKQA